MSRAERCADPTPSHRRFVDSTCSLQWIGGRAALRARGAHLIHTERRASL